MRHFRAAGICGAGLLALRHKHRKDLRRLTREGMPVEDLGAWRDDPFVRRAVVAAFVEAAASAGVTPLLQHKSWILHMEATGGFSADQAFAERIWAHELHCIPLKRFKELAEEDDVYSRERHE